MDDLKTVLKVVERKILLNERKPAKKATAKHKSLF